MSKQQKKHGAQDQASPADPPPAPPPPAPPEPPFDTIVAPTAEAVREMFVRALRSAGTDIEKLLATNGSVPMSGTLTELTTSMIKILEARVSGVTSMPKGKP